MVTNKEHQHNIKGIRKSIEDSNVQLRIAGMRVNEPKSVKSSKSKRKKR
jgi:hypothetical protein